MPARTTLCCVCALLFLLCQQVGAFTTVISIPPDAVSTLDPLWSADHGGYLISPDVQINLVADDDLLVGWFAVSGGELNIGPANTTGAGLYATVSGGGVVNVDHAQMTEVDIEDGGVVNAHGSYLGPTSIYSGGRLDMKGGVAPLIHVFGGEAVLDGVDFALSTPGILGVAGGDNDEPGFVRFSAGVLPEGKSSFLVGYGGSLVIESAVMPEAAGWVVDEGGSLELQGYGFAIDEVLVEGLEQDTPLEIPDREFTLTGRFVDGAPFEIYVSESEVPSGYQGLHLEMGGVLRVTLAVPEPTGLGLYGGMLALAAASRSRRAA